MTPAERLAELLDAYDRLYHRHQVLRRHLAELVHGPPHEQPLPSPAELRLRHHQDRERVDL